MDGGESGGCGRRLAPDQTSLIRSSSHEGFNLTGGAESFTTMSTGRFTNESLMS